MTTYFISDLHLEESRRPITDAFLAFLKDTCSDAEALYILGDFFEAWIGDDEKTALQQEVAGALNALNQQGVSIYFQHGNRDFLLGQDYADQCGMRLLSEEHVISLYDKPVLLMHGDSLCTNDHSYMKFRKNVRSPEAQKAFLARSLAERQLVAKQMRAMSMAQNQGKKEAIMDVTPEEVEAVLTKHKVDTLIHGHTHRPNSHNFELAGVPKRRIVLGDWDSALWYAKATPNKPIELVQVEFA